MTLFASLLSFQGFEILGLLFWLWMIVECWKREKKGWPKIGWMLLVVLLPAFGSLIYFLLRVARIRV